MPIKKLRWLPWPPDWFSTSSLQPLSWIQFNLTGSKILTSAIKFVFFGSIRKPRWPRWSLIGWAISDFFSAAEWNLAKFWQEARNQCPILQVCIFFWWFIKTRWLSGLWLVVTSLKFNKVLQEGKSLMSSTKFVFSGPIKKLGWPPCLWLADTFWLLFISWKNFNETKKVAKSQCPLPKCVFPGL